MAKKVLITGVTGSGKSTLEQIFSEKGYQTSDIDDGFAEWKNKETGLVEDYQPDSAEWLSRVYWSLRSDELKERLDNSEGKPVLVFGSTNDLDQYVELFDTVFLLEYPDAESLVSRLASRPDSGYGKSPHERDSALSYFNTYQDTMKRLGAKVVDCTLPLVEVANIIETEVAGE